MKLENVKLQKRLCLFEQCNLKLREEKNNHKREKSITSFELQISDETI